MMSNNATGIGSLGVNSNLGGIGSKMGKIGFFGHLNESMNQTGAKSVMNYNQVVGSPIKKKRETPQNNDQKNDKH